MSQSALERRDFPVPMRWPHTGSDISRPGQRGRRAALFNPFQACREAYYTLPTSPTGGSAGHILLVLHPPLSPARIKSP
jgi:hypothetical protein